MWHRVVGGDFCLVHHFPVFLHLRDVVHYSSSLNKHLDQVPGNRLPHNAWLFAAGVALMPVVMNQPVCHSSSKETKYTLTAASYSEMFDWSLLTRGLDMQFVWVLLHARPSPLVTLLHLLLMIERRFADGWKCGNYIQSVTQIPQRFYVSALWWQVVIPAGSQHCNITKNPESV